MLPPNGDLPSNTEVDRLLDVLVQIVSVYGAEAIDLEGSPAAATSKLFETWAEHLKFLRPAPGAGGEAASGRSPRRDLFGLRDSFVQHRRRERQVVTGAVGDLKGVVWRFVQSIGRAIPEDAEDDTRAAQQLARLRGAVEGQSIERLKNEAASTLAVLGDVITRRRERDRTRAVELERVVLALGHRLEVAQRDGAIDPLTQIGNRRSLDDHLERTIELVGLSESPACLLLIDADRFKRINDVHGHPAGDATLVAIAKTLVRSFPRTNDCIARYGGEEFAVVLRDCGVADGQRLAERARAAVRRIEVPVADGTVQVSVSIGVAELGHGEPASSWIARADAALYTAKRSGRDRVVLAPPEPRVAAALAG